MHHQLYHHLPQHIVVLQLYIHRHHSAHHTSKQYVCGCNVIVCSAQVYQKYVSTGMNEVQVILQDAVYHQSTVVAVTMQSQSHTYVTNQVLSTVATDVSLDDQVTFLLYASDGVTIASN